MALIIATAVMIDAPPARVWSVLMDFARYPDWNPFILSIDGRPEVGQKLKVVIRPPGRRANTFRPVVTEMVPERSFKWRGSLPIPGLFEGEHRFAVYGTDDGTRFDQSEKFSGVLVPYIGRILDATEQGFHAMNQAIKMRAEAKPMAG